MKTSSTEVHSEFETGVRTIASNPFPGVLNPSSDICCVI